MGFYDEIENEQAANNRGEYMRAGAYLILLSRIRSGYSKKDSCDFAAIDGTILHVLPSGPIPKIVGPSGNLRDWIDDPRGHNRVGEDVSTSFMRKWLSARRNFKAFIANAIGVASEALTGPQCTEIENNQLLAGEVLEISNTMVEKKDGGPFTKVWCKRRVSPAEYAEVLDPAVIERFFPEGIPVEE